MNICSNEKAHVLMLRLPNTFMGFEQVSSDREQYPHLTWSYPYEQLCAKDGVSLDLFYFHLTAATRICVRSNMALQPAK